MASNGEGAPTVADLVAQITSELEDVDDAEAGAAAIEYRRGGQLFGVVSGPVVALRLRPDIAEAALRTPGTAPSGRGTDWIEFRPDPAAQHDVDRLRAWLTIGWRSAQRHN